MTDQTEVSKNDLTRRRFLQGSALAGFGAFLAACGTKGTGATGSPSAAATAAATATAAASASPTTAASPTPKPSPSANMNFANWPLYIDTDDKDNTKHKTLEDFTKKYGTKIKYAEVIDDNESFFGTIKPSLEAGQDTTWDLIVLTDWMASKVIRLGWTEQQDQGNMPNKVKNLKDIYLNVDFDPTNDHHAPWQSGMTGLGFDSKKTGDLTSLAVLWDTKYKGKVDYLTEMRDAIGLTMLKLGKDPSQATRADCDAAAAEIKTAVDAGIVRAFKGNAYAVDLVKGDVILSMAWSGDIVQKQLEKASLKFNVADEGGMLWTDNMLIPKGAKNKYTAELFVDFAYTPEIAAQIEAYVNYICPVNGAKEVLVKNSPDIANNPLIFPPDAVLAKLKIFKTLTEDDETYFNKAFLAVSGG
jgi:spermidine/putrescine transport system substrate-binding protein